MIYSTYRLAQNGDGKTINSIFRHKRLERPPKSNKNDNDEHPTVDAKQGTVQGNCKACNFYVGHKTKILKGCK